MRILIDGYNLLFQSPLVERGRGPGWLERARKKLIAYLQSQMPKELLRQTTIVFDASQTGETAADFRTEQGMTVLFARQHPEADDLLEDFIRKHSSPKSLTVVSSDQRIRRRAKARRARDLTSSQFLEELDKNHALPKAQIPKEGKGQSEGSSKRGDRLDEKEIAYWLEKFDFKG